MAAWSEAPIPVALARFAVLVTLVNDQGHRSKLLGFGPTVDEAVADAERKLRDGTADDSWVADDWEAA